MQFYYNQKMEKVYEVNFDGLVGPTHHYGGLSFGNIASTNQKAQISNPREAALQGLAKMKALADLGFKQAMLPPQRRPDLEILKQIGLTGDSTQIINAAWKACPEFVSACYSSSCMWTANAASVAPSMDTSDGRVHFTAANLFNKFHRSIEAQNTYLILKKIFNNDRYFMHHPPLPNTNTFGDEGAANHTRFCHDYGEKGVHFFVFGCSEYTIPKLPVPQKFPARQTLEASQSIARLHGLDENKLVYAQQNPDVIDQGAFHNDVVAVGNKNILFCHEFAYLNQKKIISSLQEKMANLKVIEVPDNLVSVKDAVQSYLFNSQLLSGPNNQVFLIAPIECQENIKVAQYLKSAPFDQILYFDLRQSMQNGGGPACLRLRVVLNSTEIHNCKQSVFINDENYNKLCLWVKKHYRDRLSIHDLKDPLFYNECNIAMDSLNHLLDLH